MIDTSVWFHFQQHFFSIPGTGLSLDTSQMGVPTSFWEEQAHPLQQSLQHMKELEAGVIANPDEQRQVGHYWLRTPELAPTTKLRQAIEQTLQQVQDIATQVLSGKWTNEQGQPFRHGLVIGIGGSALGPQFIDRALAQQGQGLKLHYLDNTDPDGFEQVFAELGEELPQTLCMVISKSGGTQETRNAMLVTQHVFREAGLSFGKQAVAITSRGSKLDQLAAKEGWYARLPMWDWVGGRTSVFSAVGLLPAALQGIDLKELLDGAKLMDQQGRQEDLSSNPAAQLALNWWYAGNGRGEKAMVVLPYKDRLSLFSSYLQQLVMESLGKERNLEGRVVRQGLTVYGNKGSTDQHAYIQQLREGRNDFFAQFLEVLKDQEGPAVEVDPGATSGDYLLGFLLGTRQALREKQRQSMTLTLDSITPRSIGALIALFERAVGIYAHLVGINAYHQPGVEAGKKAAGTVLQLQDRLIGALNEQPNRSWTVDELSRHLQAEKQEVAIFKVLEHLAANGRVDRHQVESSFSNRYQSKSV